MTYDVLTQQNARKTLQRLTGIEWSTWQYLNRNYNKEQFLSDEDYVKRILDKEDCFLPAFSLCLVGDKSDDIPGYKGIGEVKARKFLDQFGSIENFLESEEKFPGIDNEGLSELYKRNKSLIDIRVALKEYPITTIPIYYNKKNEILIKKLMGQFSEYSLNSFLTQEFLKPFKTLKQWKNI